MNEDIIKNEITKGVAQVDRSLTIESFSCGFDRQTRKASVYFSAKTESGEAFEVSNKWD